MKTENGEGNINIAVNDNKEKILKKFPHMV